MRKTLGVLAVATVLPVATATGQVGRNQSVLNPNIAGEAELATVPNLNADLVKAIVERRPFLDVMDLHALLSQTLNEGQLEDTYARLFVPINLNTASEESILLIPGVGNRMAHEFEEYRPYDGLPRFRREIGKYVDNGEVTRLEQYVFVPIDLNTASREAIMTIPGVGERMAHEFEEYRPYTNIAQFRREIGKYVDEKEVARLERYVVIR